MLAAPPMNKIYALIISAFFLLTGFSEAANIPMPSSTRVPGAAPGIKITGKVTDSQTGETIIGAIITIKNTTNGTTTDVDGNYTITVPDADAILVFSFIGYDPQEITVKAQTVINVVLVTKATQLDQVVVVGYGTQKKG